ncbi:prephenate dehydrogenase/arogenate dehydrogenase family protein [Spirilliplanes yamanashiensis]|uniref:Prephenate dehydrogenase n=1 Tax=Spirilliplanes yamanashiensis TaxID=42233 RepID=A0A8J3Y6P3_9ACTN|nr:prephenate dehydrogenase/arogenate dehydrogenase family protein [Spirilliplanes yamanashiensis]MDP9814689.1 prephenate dehydrogenase [Spirilliplanes yamanashiensis]GIJ02342.1 prephenate dehydrogenase [Spirilliplanes yamanashiensis]
MNIAVLGLGLIGGSLLRALSAAGHAVLGFDADPATRATARTAAALAPAGRRWQIAGSVKDAVATADLAVLAVPLPAVAGVLGELGGFRGLLTDVTSVKGPVRDLVGGRRFVGGHPMAGKETSGFGAADPALFEGAAWVLCLEEETATADWLTLAALVTGLGARAVPATAADHDRAVATVSHVPHLLATALAAAAAGEPLAATLGAGSFRDGTRVAATRPELVAAMCGGNAGAVGPALDEVIRSLTEARARLAEADPVTALQPWLHDGNAARLAWPPRAGEQRDLPARADVLRRLGRAGGWVTAVSADHRTITAVLPAD